MNALSNPVVLLLVAAAFWLGWRSWQKRRTDALYGIKIAGGRSGTIAILAHDRAIRAEFEVGATVDLLIYGSSLVATDLPELTDAE